MAAFQPEEGATTIPEDTTNQQDATTTASSSTVEPETFTTLTAWGYNGHGQLGNGTTTDSSTPVEVSDLDGVRDTAAGDSYSLALKDDGTVWAWGGNHLGRLGNGPTTSHSSTPMQVSEVSGVKAIAAGRSHSRNTRASATRSRALLQREGLPSSHTPPKPRG
jgi:alpha-tubulin suppressor-like RCC1 family protein